MITLLVGHRGVGKTTLLGRLAGYRPDAQLFDLDEEIQLRTQRSIAEILGQDGERAFRRLESDVLRSLLREVEGTRAFIALGAGFEGSFPPSVEVLWVRRATDADGRIFLDRPRLDRGVGPLEEYRARYEVRERRFREIATRQLFLREGTTAPRESERLFFIDGFRDLGGVLTLLPEHGRRGWGTYLGPKLSWGLDAFEVRNDLLDFEDFQEVLALVPPAQLLLSDRPGAAWKIPSVPGARVDRDLLVGTGAPSDIASLHERWPDESISQCLARLEREAAPGSFLKAALPVTTFRELAEGDAWRARDPGRRTFLPMSDDGRWTWYRLLRRQGLAFWADGVGSAPDQPTLLEWADTFESASFAAVLGDPVRHSWTPLAQEQFFRVRQMPVFAVRVTEPEWRDGALDVLRDLGLRAAAVTAPLKLAAFEASGPKSPAVGELQSVNTLAWNEQGQSWQAENTDIEGFLFAVRNFPLHSRSLRAEIAVWGGGGTLPLLRKIIPHASFYSARTGERRQGPGVGKPRVLVWAAGSRSEASPPHVWEPAIVLDLDYRENSLGRDYALRTGARYVSGRSMFDRQAKLQRVFWTRVLG